MAPSDPHVAALAARQRGLFTKQQLRALGYTEDQIEYRLASQTWVSRRPGVLSFATTEPDWESDQLATTVWSRGITSHRAAARLYGLPLRHDDSFEVTTFDREIMPRCGIVVHHTNRMPRDHVGTVSGIPCTSIERTLLDLGAVVGPGRVGAALDHCLHSGMTTLGCVDHCLYLTARRGRRGCRVLRDQLKRRWDLSEVPNSPLESAIFDLLISFGFPTPDPQAEIYDSAGRFVARPDFVYPQLKAVIEGHSKRWHSEPEQRARDAVRHARLVTEGYRILYVTWYDVTVIRSSAALRIGTFLGGGSGDPAPPEFPGDVTKEW